LPASFGKAKRRAENALPISPRKRVAVVRKLPHNDLQSSSISSARNAELETAVTQYYLSDSISRVMPAKSDFVTVRDKDGHKHKVKLQKKRLVRTVGECYQMFRMDHLECTVGLSKFAHLRPKNCVLTSDMPHNVCGYKYHNNIIILLENHHQKFPAVVPIYSSEFINCCL